MNIFWFRRDLRLVDNKALSTAISAGENVLALFIFDENIIDELPGNDPRIGFIYDQLKIINEKLSEAGSSLLVEKGDPPDVFKRLIAKYKVRKVFFNRDYEPYALMRDKNVKDVLEKNKIEFSDFKDHVIFEPDEVLKSDDKPYTVYTPYKNAWLRKFDIEDISVEKEEVRGTYYKCSFKFPEIEDLGFSNSTVKVKDYDLKVISNYHRQRDIPSKDATSHLGPHLRFGTISVRQVLNYMKEMAMLNEVFISELIWREFFIQIMFHFPRVSTGNFRKKYDSLLWINNKDQFKLWCEGKTGYPIVDAGMRELNKTGYMHNRVRMIAAGFLCKHLLIDWRWGEAYFASRLLDYELSSNNGNWQWAAGTGCDAAPYFRVFNPYTQQKKFDPDMEYVKKWVPEYGSVHYPDPVVEHKQARERAISAYKRSLT